MQQPSLVIGVGGSSGVDGTEVLALIDTALAALGRERADVAGLATVSAKTTEAGLRAAAEVLSVPLTGYPAAALAAVPVPHPSEAVAAATGTPSVAEAAALLAAGPGARLLSAKRRSPRATVAVADGADGESGVRGRSGADRTDGESGVRGKSRTDRTDSESGAGRADRESSAADADLRHHGDAALPAAGPGARLLSAKRRSPRATVAVADGADGESGAVEPDLRHHGDAEVRAAGLVDLAVNVRTGTPPEWLRAHLAATLGELAAYPEGSRARAAVAARHGRPVGEVLLTSGAAEAFVLLARVLAPRHAVVVHPQFTEPEAALRDAGHPVHRVLLSPADGFRLAPGAVPEEADLVVVGNPTNPTSVLHPAATLAALARPGRTLVVDEAFVDTVPGERESLAGPHDLPGEVVVLRSLTKTWGLAGLRIGYVLGPAPLIARLAAAQPLWPVSTPALAAAEACSTPAALAEADAAAHTLAVRRAHLLARLAELPAVTVHGEPAASFVLVHTPGAAALRERLRAAGFAVRRGDTFPGLGPDWLRIAVRDEATTDAFLAALAALLP
ncbi:Rv2231c family pyridoxal phosphate-dependent protein CobC [Kitasatospora sp. NPDC096147]|uniref:Rv2231c family pyridoxal phosphate-dependent protein CobC n=1 Tax=Kitasatospora sp. NPDC096147 TaxID=3364093 RepID=UPI0037FEAE4A